MRSMFAVMFGFMVMILAKIFLTEILLKILGPHPDQAAVRTLAWSLLFAVLAAMVGGIVTAAIAGRFPIKHAATLAIIVFALSAVPFMRHTGAQPMWYQELLLIAPPLCAVAGAALYARNRPATP